MIEPATRIGRKYQNPVPTTVGSPSMPFKVLWRHLTNKAERKPRQPLGPFHTDASVYHQPPASALRVTWLGHSSLLIELDGARVLVDPIWNQRASPAEWFGPKRFFAPTLALEDLPPIDVVLISHDHYDHLGALTIRRLANLPATAGARWITSKGVGTLLVQLGVNRARLSELDWTESVTAGPLTITALPARHFSGRSLRNRFETLWSSFVLAGPAHRVYYGADSGEWDGFAEVGQLHGPFDLTLLEIGAFDPLWRDIHMGPDGAARTFQSMGSHGLLMPIHWALFDLALHAWRDPIERLFAIPGLKLFSPEPGLPTEVSGTLEIRSPWWQPSPR